MVGITELIAAGKEFGIFEFYLPFILMFAILYGILQRVKIFGDKSGLNIIISLVAAAFVMVYPPIGVTLSQFFANLFGQTLIVLLSIIAFVVVFLVVVGGVTGGKKPEDLIGKWENWVKLIVLGALVLAVGVFFSSGGAAFFPGLKVNLTLPNFGVSPQTLAIIIVVVLTGIVIWFIREKPAAGK